MCIRDSTFSDNISSIRVLEKNGFSVKESFVEDGRESVYLEPVSYTHLLPALLALQGGLIPVLSQKQPNFISGAAISSAGTVSYTHLDVYKRQPPLHTGRATFTASGVPSVVFTSI